MEGRRDAGIEPVSGSLRRGVSASPRQNGLSKQSLCACLLYTSDAADERSSVDLGGRRIIKKKKNNTVEGQLCMAQ